MANKLLERLTRQARQVQILREKAEKGQLTEGQRQDLALQKTALLRTQENYLTEKEMGKLYGEDRARRIAKNKFLAETGIIPDMPLDWAVPGGTPREYQRQNEAEKNIRR